MVTSVSEFTDVDELLANRHDFLDNRISENDAPAIGYLYDYVPSEIIEATGCTPVRVAPYESDIEIREASGNLQTSFTCGFVNATFEELVRGRYEYLDGLVTGHACTPLQRMHEQVTYPDMLDFTHYVKAPTKLESDAPKAFYAEELERLATAVAEYAGTAVDGAAIETAIEKSETERERLAELFALRTRDQPKLSGEKALKIAFAVQLLPTNTAIEYIDELLPAVRDHAPIEGQRTFVTGCSTYKTDLVGLIEREGGIVVADDAIEGGRTLSCSTDRADDPYERLAVTYLDKPAGSYKADFDSRLEFIKSRLDRHDVEKVIMLTPKFCDPYMLRKSAIRELVEESGRDFLELTFEHALADEGQLRLRVQSFFERG